MCSSATSKLRGKGVEPGSPTLPIETFNYLARLATLGSVIVYGTFPFALLGFVVVVIIKIGLR